MIYKFPDSNRRIEKLKEKIRRILLKSMRDVMGSSIPLTLHITRLHLSSDLSKVKVGLYCDHDLENHVALMNEKKTHFNKELHSLATKRTPRCQFFADAQYHIEQVIINRPPQSDHD